MTTIGAIIFLIYPGQKVATVEMFDAIQSGEYGVGSAMASLIIIITLIINILFTKFIIGGSMYLKINNLVKVFNNVKVVDNINLELEKGKLLCLLGPSGCGKTLLLKL